MLATLPKFTVILIGFLFVWTLDGLVSRVQNASTHFVDIFPDNMDDITALLNRTNRHLLIVTDFCAYGEYSNPEAYEKYRNAVERLPNPSHSRQIEIHTYDSQTGDKAIRDQLSDWDTIRKSTTFKRYFEYHAKDPGNYPVPTSKDQLIGLMQRREQECIDQFRSNSDISIRPTINRVLPVFLWLRDDQEAMFSIYNLGENGSREATLVTNDPRLFLTLRDVAYHLGNQ